MTMRYTHDVAVAYRIYPGVSRPALGLPFSDDKYRLSEICLHSFKESLGSLRVKVWAILDGCPPEYAGLFRNYFADADLELVPCDALGNHATFARQIDILLGQRDAPLVYFAEDDYFYLPSTFSLMVDFLKAHTDVDFVSPFDHLDCYTTNLHRTPKWIRPYGNHHWRTAASTCLTFLTRKEVLASCEPIFRSYARGNFDCAIWLSLTKQRVLNPLALARYLVRGEFYWRVLVKSWLYCSWQILFGDRFTLWVPIPGIATHLDRNALSPAVDWIGLMKAESVTIGCVKD
ncbi:MAG TPA: hypothetical protein VN950_21080 [Terriglobales bacterium]|nr:hypothetical protein [Terriglobales bacterium]